MQWVRVPLVGDETGNAAFTGGSGNQLRVYGRYSVLDAARAGRVVGATRGACDAEIRADELERFLTSFETAIVADAHRARIAFLDETRVGRQQIVESARARVVAHESTVVELDEILVAVDRIEATFIDSRRMLDGATEQVLPFVDAASVDVALAAQETSAVRAAELASSSRRLDGIAIDVRGGAVPVPTVDWFGSVVVSYRLGDVAMRRREAEGLASTREAITLTGSLHDRIREWHERTHAELSALESRAELLGRRKESLREIQALVASSAAPGVRHRIDVIALELSAVEAELRFVTTFRERLAPFATEASHAAD